MIKYVLIFSFSFLMLTASAQYVPGKENLAARAQFQDMKFGLFIHWGASSVLGSGEWIMNQRNIKVNEYKRLMRVFNPIDFNAKEWVSMAKRAGMKYITFISRHHDGFSNWDTKQSDWKVTNTPYGKDIILQLAEECRQQGIKLFLYYSLLDWYRSDYQYETGKTGKGTGRTEKSDWNSYIRFMKAQLTELLTSYGEIGGIWFDGHWDQLDNDHDKTLKAKVDWHYEEIYELIHRLQPNCLIANNHHMTPLPGEDYQAFEKDLPGGNTTGFGGASVSALPLETCETMNNSWGYNITDRNFKTKKSLIHYMVNAAGRNANFLLNVGPMPNGQVQPEFIDTLNAMGEWMKQYGNSLYGTRGNILPPQEWGVVTAKDKSWFLHVLHQPFLPYIFIPQVAEKVKAVSLFKNQTGLKFKQVEEGVFVYIDASLYDEVDTVIQLNF